MPDRDWLSDAAARGLLILALSGTGVAAVAQTPGPPNSPGVAQQAPQEQQRAQTGQSPSAPLFVKMVPEDQPKSGDPEPACKDDPEAERRDLCQQSRMADAAEKQLDLLTRQNEIAIIANALLREQNELLHFQNWMLIAEAGLLFLAFGASAAATYFTGRQTKETQREFVTTHRPKIRIKHIWLIGKIEPGKPIYVDFEMVNTGATEAHMKLVTFKSDTLTRGERLLPRFFSDQKSQLLSNPLLPPGLTATFPNYNIHSGVSAEELANMMRGSKILYFAGVIQYRDSGKRLRHTAFCRILKFSESGDARFYREDDPDYEYED